MISDMVRVCLSWYSTLLKVPNLREKNWQNEVNLDDFFAQTWQTVPTLVLHFVQIRNGMYYTRQFTFHALRTAIYGSWKTPFELPHQATLTHNTCSQVSYTECKHSSVESFLLEEIHTKKHNY
jgi:hypothetical protein